MTEPLTTLTSRDEMAFLPKMPQKVPIALRMTDARMGDLFQRTGARSTSGLNWKSLRETVKPLERGKELITFLK